MEVKEIMVETWSAMILKSQGDEIKKVLFLLVFEMLSVQSFTSQKGEMWMQIQEGGTKLKLDGRLSFKEWLKDGLLCMPTPHP